jgi:hypothetical protein
MAPMLTGSAATGSSISGLDLLNLFSAATSIVLAIVALALAIFFFVQSKNAADQASKSADGIASTVARLEALFSTLYADTFSMMRDTVTDMRQHIWKLPPEDPNDDKDRAIEAERARSQAVLAELERVSRRIGIQDAMIAQLRADLAPTVDHALQEQEEATSRMLAQSWQQYRTPILLSLRSKPLSADELRIATGISSYALMYALADLRRKNLITWDGPEDQINMEQPIFLTRRNETRSPAKPSERNAEA